jgi:hypothetical protein
MKRTSLFAVSAALAAWLPLAQASCGSAFCLVNTNWNAQGAWTEPGWRADLHYEYINQDQPRAGTKDLSVGELSQHHDEVQTVNRNWFATLDYGFAPNWGASVILPWVDRSHDHIHNHHGEAITESWKFSDPGDVRIAGHYQRPLEDADALRLSYVGIGAGLKLPTGKTDVANDDGEVAERSLQPGTGTTDLTIGAYYRQALGAWNASWFTQIGAQLPLNSHDGYKPGRQVLFDVGGRWEATASLGLLLQLNASWKGSDSGSEAEPEDSGGRWVFLSPGFTFAVGRNFNVYGFVQLPLYQDVNGVQLVAKQAYTVGASVQF